MWRKSKDAARLRSESELGNELIKNAKNCRKLVENVPKNSNFRAFLASNYKPGYPGFEAKKPNPLKWKKPGF